MPTRGYAALLAGLLVLGFALPASAATEDPRYARFVSEDVSVGEAPHAVAVADDGLIAVALFNDKSIALLPGAGGINRVPIGCSPASVEISPDASTAWAVCQGDPHVHVIDVLSGQSSVAEVGLREANDIVYLPGPKRLVIADLAGEIVVVSATSSQDYEVVDRIPTGASRPSDLAVLPSGTRGFATTDAGRLLAFDVKARTSRVMSGLAPDAFLSSIALSRGAHLLYAGAAIGSSASGFHSAIVALDPVTGATVQESALTFTSPGSTTIKVAAGHRSLSVATGLAIDLDGESTGLFDVALDDRGRMGERSRVMPAGVLVLGTDVSRSADGTHLAAGTTNDRAVGVFIEDPPYPPTLRVQGNLRGTKLTLAGTTTGMPAGTVVTVYVRDLTRPKQRFVKQSTTAVVDDFGAYRWTSAVRVAKVQVYTETQTPAVSPRVTISRAR